MRPVAGIECCPIVAYNEAKEVFSNVPTSASFIFGLFKQTSLQILLQINVKKVHPVYGAGIQTYNLRNMSLLP